MSFVIVALIAALVSPAQACFGGGRCCSQPVCSTGLPVCTPSYGIQAGYAVAPTYAVGPAPANSYPVAPAPPAYVVAAHPAPAYPVPPAKAYAGKHGK